MYTETGRKLPQNYDISFTCDLMEFPLRALARKIYFLLEAWRSRWPRVLDKLLKVKIFTVKKVYFTLIIIYNSPVKRKTVAFIHKSKDKI